MLPITSFFAALCGFMLIGLSVNVIRTRKTLRVLIGDGGQEAMQRAVRAQANFCEYIPLALILMALLEIREVNDWLLVIFGVALVVGRSAHAYSLIKVEMAKADAPIDERIQFRKIGMFATFGVIGFESLLLLVG